ncbi:MAG: sigma-54-dependent transcriptional regulator [Chitinophagales bacterium]
MAKMAKILIIDDERSIRRTLKEILQYEGYKVDEAADGMQGMVKIKTGSYDVVFCDIKMPKMNGLEVLEHATKLKPDLPIVMISGHGTMETAVEAVKKGAFDFIAKPLDLNRLLITVRNALDKSNLLVETKTLRRKVTKVRDIVGKSEAITKITDTIARVAPTDARILITGENGTGKEMVARWIHEKSNRNKGPFIEVNCAAIPAELIESELFGHEKGAFTSAHKQRIGKFELANGGTLFLDEIGDMSLSAQAKVLRALQENKITRVGGDKDIQVDVRIVSATNKKLLQEVEKARFRLDLYHRLNVIPIIVPSLNNRKEDIPILAEHFIKEICGDYNIKPKVLDKDAIQALKELNWTGNVRELRNVIERLIILSNKRITKQDVNTYVMPSSVKHANTDINIFEKHTRLQDFKDTMEKNFLKHKLQKNSWNISKTAEEVDIQRSHLYNKIEKYSLRRK